jgi:hypothetical protein
MKHVRLDDTWEQFKVRFTIFYPLTQPGDKLQVVTEQTHHTVPGEFQRDYQQTSNTKVIDL